jgi:Flp pilus assembly protein TadG
MTIRFRPTRLHSDDRGVALVEFAFVLPLLLVLVLGIVDFGRALNYWIDQTHLANMGARWAAVNKNPGADSGQALAQYIESQAASPELRSRVSATICRPGATTNVGDPIHVVVRSDFQWLAFLTNRVGLQPVTLEASATMRIEVARTDEGYPAPGACT